jgi:hypothetical protein
MIPMRLVRHCTRAARHLKILTIAFVLAGGLPSYGLAQQGNLGVSPSMPNGSFPLSMPNGSIAPPKGNYTSPFAGAGPGGSGAQVIDFQSMVRSCAAKPNWRDDPFCVALRKVIVEGSANSQ